MRLVRRECQNGTKQKVFASVKTTESLASDTDLYSPGWIAKERQLYAADMSERGDNSVTKSHGASSLHFWTLWEGAAALHRRPQTPK
jgi:hypothetical protein